MSPEPTEPAAEAEQAAAEALARHFNLNYSDGIERHGVINWAPEARAVVAAVRPLIEADALEALADGAASYGPPTADQLRGIAFMVRKGLRSVRAWLDADAAALRTTTSEHKGDPR